MADECEKYVAESGHFVAEVAGEVVLLHQRTGEYFGLNSVGARIWAHLEVPRTMASLVDAVVGEFNAAEDLVRHDVEVLIQSLVVAGLVRRH